MADPPRLVLASRSPRRAQILSQLGLSFETEPADVDEKYLEGEKPAAHVERLARAKALSVGQRDIGALVVGSDTIVVVDAAVLGKPRDRTDAIAMLMRLQGRVHEVATGVAVVRNGETWSAAERVRVLFRPFDEAFAAAYAATGEPLDKAGAYGIQGYGAALVERIVGDYFAVMGLPIARLLWLLQQAGFRYNFVALIEEGRG